MSIFKSLALFSFLFLSVGCAGTMQTARTNGEGNFQFGVEPGVTHYIPPSEVSDGTGVNLNTTLPSFNLAGRYGVSDRIDIGARIGTVGYDVHAKFMITDPNDQQSIAMSMAPSITVAGGSVGGAGSFIAISRIPFLVGIPFGDHELTVTPRATPIITTGTGGTAFLLSGGGSVGFAARVADTFWVVPELSVDVPFLGAVDTDAGGGGDVGFGGTIVNFGVGLLFGGRGVAGTNVMPPATNTGGTVIP